MVGSLPPNLLWKRQGSEPNHWRMDLYFIEREEKAFPPILLMVPPLPLSSSSDDKQV